MQNFDDLDIEGRNPHSEEKGKEEYDRKRIMRSSVTAEDGVLRPVYSETENGDIWCHICNVALFGAHKLVSHNMCNRHKIKLDEWPYPVMLWSKRPETGNLPAQTANIADTLAPGEPVPPGMEDQMVRTTAIQTSLDRHQSSPLVGLEYLLELVDNDSCEPNYTCVLCDKRGDPRTVMAHITSYNHRINYLNRHFPTISRAITELPRTPNYKRGANEILVLVARKIEKKFGRMQPQLVDKSQYEKNKMEYIKKVYQDMHFRETPECTFMEVYDVKWVTNFEEKMAEVNGNNRKKDAIAEEKIDDKFKREDKKKEKSPKKSDTKEDKPIFKMRIINKDKTNFRKSSPKVEEKPASKVLPKRPSDEIKSLSSLSSISSSPSPSRSKSRSPERAGRGASRKSADRRSTDRHHRYRSDSRHSRRTRSRSRSLPPVRERDKWEKYREQIRRAEETLDRALKFHEKNPEKHPSYPDEWKKFWNRRYKELQAEGSDPSKHDFKPEWIEFWNKRMREIHTEQLQQRKEEIRKRLELPEDKPPGKWYTREDRERARDRDRERERSPPKRGRHHPDSDDEVEYVGTKVIKSDYYDRHETYRETYPYPSYTRGGNAGYARSYQRTATRGRPMYYATPYPVKDKSSTPPPVADEVLKEDLEIVGLLRLLTALEGQLGSLGPKIVSLLSKALAAEKVKPNSAEELLYDEEVSVLFETVKEKLKGQLFAGMVEKMAVTATKTGIQNIAKLMHKASENKKKLEEERRKVREKELLEATKPSYISTRSIFPRAMGVLTPKLSVIRSEPVSVAGIGTVDKVAIAEQIAAALVAQGRTNVSQEELETLINAVVGMAEASKNSEKPVTTADFVKSLAGCNTAAAAAAAAAAVTPTSTIENPATLFTTITTTTAAVTTAATTTTATASIIPGLEQPVSRMESMTDAELKSKLQTFKDLSTQEQHGLIGFLRKLEASDPSRVEKLRDYVNLGVSAPSSGDAEFGNRGRKSVSPFSRKVASLDERNRWKPKLDMFADDEDESQKNKRDNDELQSKTKTKLDLSDDDDDYTYEDIYKAANKNVSENERAKKSRSYSKSPRSWSRSRSRSKSRSRSPMTKPPAKDALKSTDPNTILNETKRLIANIMCDLPNKFAPKSHGSSSSTVNPPAPSVGSVGIEASSIAPGASSFYNHQNFVPSGGQQPRPQTQPLTYPNLSGQQFTGYPQQQMFPNNPPGGYMDNGGGYHGYQGYGNMNTQNQYAPPSMSSNQYPPPHQQPYHGAYSSQTAHPGGYVPQTYDNYMPPQQQQQQQQQQQRFY